MSSADLTLVATEREQLGQFFEPRAAAVDTGQASVRDGLLFLHQEHFAPWVDDGDPLASPNDDLGQVAATIATVAWSDMTSAFSLWCHRMVLDYLAAAPPGSYPRATLLPALLRVESLGSTALASAMSYAVAGVPLPITARRDGDGLILSGRIFWASNLLKPDYTIVTVAAGPDDGAPIVIALSGDAPGLEVDPYPVLMALQATYSSSLTLTDVPVRPEQIITTDFRPFVGRIRSTFLLLQSSFCLGLTRRCLEQARTGLRHVNQVFESDLNGLETELERLTVALTHGTANRRAPIPVQQALQIRLAAAQLTAAAVGLEARTAGGRGYVATSPTARRMREAAFLPIQAPTEGQLRWELARYG